MRYSEKVSLTSTSGALDRYDFAGNGLYDPNLTGTGHQPYCFDTYNVLYRRYCVHGARIKVTMFSAPVVGTNIMVAVAARPYMPGGSLPTFIGAALERPRTQGGVVTEMLPAVVRTQASTEDMVGVTRRLQIADNDLTPYSNANPAVLWYFSLYAEAAYPVASIECYALVEIEYDTSFFERVQQGTS